MRRTGHSTPDTYLPSAYPPLPLEISCVEDPDWEDYHEMLQMEETEEGDE